MGKAGSESADGDMVMLEDAPVNIGALLAARHRADERVLGIQTKLHSWAAADPGRRFDDLFNLVADPAFLVMAWTRVRENKGARTAGIDKQTAHSIEASAGGVEEFLEDLRSQLKQRTFRPLPVRQRRIPKSNGKLRSLGIPTVADRVVQACLKLVLEPILETGFSSSSYGFRPGRRAQDAIEDIRLYAHKGYEWVFEADIASCFDEISHTAVMDRLRERVGDKRVLALVKAFRKAGCSMSPVSPRTPPQALPRAAFCRRCWPTSHCPYSTITSTEYGRPVGRPGTGNVTGNAEEPTTAWCGMPTTS